MMVTVQSIGSDTINGFYWITKLADSPTVVYGGDFKVTCHEDSCALVSIRYQPCGSSALFSISFSTSLGGITLAYEATTIGGVPYATSLCDIASFGPSDRISPSFYSRQTLDSRGLFCLVEGVGDFQRFSLSQERSCERAGSQSHIGVITPPSELQMGACCGIGAGSAGLTVSTLPQCQCQHTNQRFLGVGVVADQNRRRMCCFEVFSTCSGLPSDWKTNPTAFGVFPPTLSATLTISQQGASALAETVVAGDRRQEVTDSLVSLSGAYSLGEPVAGSVPSSFTCGAYYATATKQTNIMPGGGGETVVGFEVGFGFGDDSRTSGAPSGRNVPRAYATVRVSPVPWESGMLPTLFCMGYGDSPCTYNPYIPASSCWAATAQLWCQLQTTSLNPQNIPCSQRYVQVGTLSVSSS
jgi:hypothetical protein